MNQKRRQAIVELLKILGAVSSKLEILMEEEDEYRESMPENLQSSQKYDDSEEASENLEEAYDAVNNAIDALEGIS